MPGIYMGSGYLSSGLHAFTASFCPLSYLCSCLSEQDRGEDGCMWEREGLSGRHCHHLAGMSSLCEVWLNGNPKALQSSLLIYWRNVYFQAWWHLPVISSTLRQKHSVFKGRLDNIAIPCQQKRKIRRKKGLKQCEYLLCVRYNYVLRYNGE